MATTFSWRVQSVKSDPNDDEFIKIDDEVIGVTSASTNDLTVIRGMFGTTATTHSNGATVKRVFKIATSSDDSWAYISEADVILLKNSVHPISDTIETGTNWDTLYTRIMVNASRYFDSRVDANLPREQWKDREGNFDYLVVRTTALIAACFLIKANKPQSEDLPILIDEYEFNSTQNPTIRKTSGELENFGKILYGNENGFSPDK